MSDEEAVQDLESDADEEPNEGLEGPGVWG